MGDINKILDRIETLYFSGYELKRAIEKGMELMEIECGFIPELEIGQKVTLILEYKRKGKKPVPLKRGLVVEKNDKVILLKTKQGYKEAFMIKDFYDGSIRLAEEG